MASVMLLFVVFVFDLIAFGLAVAAEQRRTTWQVVNESRYSNGSRNRFFLDLTSESALHDGGEPMLMLWKSLDTKWV